MELKCSDKLLLMVKQKASDCLVAVMTFCSFSAGPRDWGGLPYEKVGDACQKI